jgi:hypothetical protein
LPGVKTAILDFVSQTNIGSEKILLLKIFEQLGILIIL